MAACPLESAIPPHLRQARTQPAKLRPAFTPPYPSWTPRFPESTQDIAMAVIGAQYASQDAALAAPPGAGVSKIKSFVAGAGPSAPAHYDTAAHADTRGYYNVAVLAYWPSAAAFDAWAAASGFGAWWDGLEAGGGCGYFLEAFLPSADRFECVVSGEDIREGAGRMGAGLSGCPVQEHGYWGSMRDRLAASQTDGLAGEQWSGLARVDSAAAERGGASKRGRVSVPGTRNLCVIRSGQDWSGTRPAERTLYLDTMHPVLVRGMEFLASDKGADEVGCYSCRFMDEVDSEGVAGRERTFGLAYFDELASLEKWASRHKTHLDIFGRFLKYTKELENDISLKLWHDVMVLEPEQQRFEYVGCHGETGMLRALD